MTARARNKREARVYADARLRQFLTHIIEDSMRYMQYASRDTITYNDVVLALKRNHIFLHPPASAGHDNRENNHQHNGHNRDRHRDANDN